MAKADILDRITADLAIGRTHPAIQRLSSLVQRHPTDLDLRRRLAAAHRLAGNSVEAGRWSYLNPDANPSDVSAFERAYPWPAQRLRRLRWPDSGGYPATEFARRRLTALRAHAGEADPVRRPAPPPPREPHRWSGAVAAVPVRRWRAGVLVIGALGALLAILGVVTVAQWIVG